MKLSILVLSQKFSESLLYELREEHLVNITGRKDEAIEMYQQGAYNCVIMDDCFLHLISSFDSKVPFIILTDKVQRTDFQVTYFDKNSQNCQNLKFAIHSAMENFDIQNKMREQDLDLQFANEMLERSAKKCDGQTNRLKNLMQQLQEAIVIVDKHGNILFSNCAAAKLFHNNVEKFVESLLDLLFSTKETLLEIVDTNDKTVTLETRVIETEWQDTKAYVASFVEKQQQKQKSSFGLKNFLGAALSS